MHSYICFIFIFFFITVNANRVTANSRGWKHKQANGGDATEVDRFIKLIINSVFNNGRMYELLMQDLDYTSTSDRVYL